MSTEVLGTCHHDCPDSCGWVATVDDGIAVKLRGNPDHPYSDGQLCPKVNRFIDRVYSPDRILRPLVRSGPKGSGEFRETSWDEALTVAAEGLTAAIERHGGETVLPWYSAGTQGLIQQSSLDQRFLAKIGSSRQVGSLCGGTAGAGLALTYGSKLASDPEQIEHAEFIVLWATNTLLTNRHLWPYIETAKSRGATVVVVDPFRTMTAERADWHLAPRPGTDVALMLAMMNVLIADGLIDTDYVSHHTIGFAELREHVAGWTPERAAAECGLPAEEIRRFAAAYGATKRSFIRTLIGGEHHEHGAMFFRALGVLPLLTGAFTVQGGGLARSVGSYTEDFVDRSVFASDHLAEGVSRRPINQNHLGRALTDPELDPPVTALIVWNGNPAVTVPNAATIRTGLERDDLFTIVSEHFVTDTARYADVVFPATTQLEHDDAVESWGHLYLGWNNRAIEPLGEAVPNTELWRRLSAAMGFTDPELFDDDDSLLRSALARFDLDELKNTGYVRLPLPDPLLPYANGGFATPSGRAEILNERLPGMGLPALPAYTPVDRSSDSHPLQLHTPKIHTRFLNSSYSHLPAHGPREGGPFVELHPDDAAARAIGDGDRVRVESAYGSLELTAVVGRRVGAGTVAVPFGWWGSDHADGGSANSLTADTLTDWGGGVAYGDTWVEVTPIS